MAVTEEWIVVADPSRVRVYVRVSAGSVPRIVDEIDFPAGRRKLATASTEEADAQIERWASAIARHLDACFLDGKYAWLTLVMSPPLLPRVRGALSDVTQPRVSREVALDIAALPPIEVKRKLLELCAQ
jgi:protein required for attachment to host cells